MTQLETERGMVRVPPGTWDVVRADLAGRTRTIPRPVSSCVMA